MAKKRRLITEMVEELYDCKDCIKAVLDSADKNKTTELIESGACTLPTPEAAHEYHLELKRKEEREALLAGGTT